MKLVLSRTIIGVAAVGVAVSGAALPASAASVDSHTFSTHASGTSAAAKGGDIAGYDFKAAVTQGSATFKLPKLTGCGADTTGIALGLGVEDVSGTPTTLGTVFVACNAGTPYYQLDALANGTAGTGTTDAAVGDSVTVSYVVKGSKLTVTTKDTTSGSTFTAVGSAPKDKHLTFGSFPLFIQGGDGPLAVPNFGKVTFSKVMINGKTVTKGTSVTGKNIKTGKLAKGSFDLTFSKK